MTMPTDPPATDLGAIRERWANPLVYEHGVYRRPSVAQSQADVHAMLAAYDVQTARLAAVEPLLDPLVLRAARSWVRGCASPQCDTCRAVDAAGAVGAGEVHYVE